MGNEANIGKGSEDGVGVEPRVKLAKPGKIPGTEIVRDGKGNNITILWTHKIPWQEPANEDFKIEIKDNR